jgi:hypothetical protein
MPAGGYGAPTFTAMHAARPPGALPTPGPSGPPRPPAAVPPALRWVMTVGAAAVATLQIVSLFLPIVSAGSFHVHYAFDTRTAVGNLGAPAMLALAALLFALGQDRLFDFAAGLTIAAVMFLPAYVLDMTRHVHFSSEPAGSGYKLAIAALVVGLVVGVIALWSPGRRALRGRARWWPWIVGVAAAGLAADLVAFHEVKAFFGRTGWEGDPWSIGFLALTAGTVVAALYVFGGRRIALGMLVALTVYTAVGDLVTLTSAGAQTFPKLVLVSDAVVIVAGFVGWYTMPRAAGHKQRTQGRPRS